VNKLRKMRLKRIDGRDIQHAWELRNSYKILVGQPEGKMPVERLGTRWRKDKVIPLHATEAHGVRGGIAPTHS
jgi:hypothetical protein